jgi:undecaprenyl-diphosphatase
MSILQALVLGTVQGLTEFIPVSSSGHLVLVPAALGWREPGLAFDVLLHVASLIALVAYFLGDLGDIWRGVRARDRTALNLVLLLAVASVPAGIAGVMLGDYFERSFTDAAASAVQLLITAAILVAGEQSLRFHERRTANTGSRLRHMDDMNVRDASLIGVAQAVSILPGISRSGATIATGLGLSITREDAARFAFLLAIPALLGAALVKVPDVDFGSTLGVGAGVAGFLASLVTSYAAIWGLIRYLRTNTLYPFAAYCVVAGIFFLVIV